MMNVKSPRLTASLTATIGPSYGSQSRGLPTRTLAASIPAFPAHRVGADHNFRLPFGHTRHIAEDAYGVEVGTWPLHDLAAPRTDAPSCAASLRVRLAFDIRPITRLTTEPLPALICCEGVAALVTNTIGNVATPSMSDITRVGTERACGTGRPIERSLALKARHAWIVAGIDADSRNSEVAA